MFGSGVTVGPTWPHFCLLSFGLPAQNQEVEGTDNGKNLKQYVVWEGKKEAFIFLKDGEGKSLREFSEQRFSLRVNTSRIQILGKDIFHLTFKVNKIL